MQSYMMRKIPGWINHKLESRLPGEISITSDMQTYSTIFKGESKQPLNEGEKEELKRVKNLA